MKAFDEREKTIIRERLLTRGKETFARYGLQKTTIRTLAKAAGISTGSFYLFFPSKEDLFFEILSEQIRISRELYQTERNRNLTGEPESEIIAFLHHAIQEITQDPIIRLLMEEDSQEVFRRKFRDKLNGQAETIIFTGLQSIIQDWVDRGIVTRGSTETVTHLVQILFSAALDRGNGMPELHAKSLALLVECVAAGLVQKKLS